MRILGLHATGHDAGACLIEGGRLVAIGEERLSRIKNDGAFPARAIAYVLDGAPIASVDRVVMDVCDGETTRALADLRSFGWTGPVRLVHHHLAHAASAHFMAPDDGAAILVVDAGGTRIAEWPREEPSPASFLAAPADQEVQSFFVARGRRIEALHQTFTRPGLRLGIGWLWALTTIHLGFGELEAGKTMGLAAHAPPAPDDDVVPWVAPGGDLLFDVELSVADPQTWTRHALTLFGGIPPRKRDEPIDERHTIVAARLQRTTERFLLRLAEQLHGATGAHTLCFSGGVALNVLANRRLQDDSPFRRLVVQPAASDSGIALGCALLGAIEAGGPLPAAPEISVLARPRPEAETATALAAATQRGLAVSRPGDLLGHAVERLARGEVVGWFEGGSELGPRALGHRSLLADARDPAAKERVNALVKHREPFRPFAPVVLEERRGELFDLPLPSENMLFSAPVLPAARARVPAITHVDGTARVQTVSARYPGRLRALLERFAAATGVPALLNTSLNGPGEPIVETADDAIALLERSGMHALVLEDAVVTRG
jgi:carbamoyltransferase